MAFQQYDPITIQDVKDELDKKLTSSSLFDKVYPVGSIYMSTSSTSPAELFGGTWESLKDRFLVGAGNSYAVNATGGSSSHVHTTGGHTLTENEIPKHTHGEKGGHDHTRGTMDVTGNLYGVEFDPTKGQSGDGAFSVGGEIEYWNKNGSSVKIISTRNVSFKASNGWYTGVTSWEGRHTHNSVGADGAHSHGDTGSSSSLPPYLAVYMWKRTA